MSANTRPQKKVSRCLTYVAKDFPTRRLLTEIAPFSAVLEEFFGLRLEYYAKRKVYNYTKTYVR
jgi:hypothetical protein